MNETNWISLSERKPTAEDADENGNVWWHDPRISYVFINPWDRIREGSIAFHPIPKRVVPPLPKPVEKTQQQKDREKADEIFCRNMTTFEKDAHEFANWARAEERKRFAAQCLALFPGGTELDLCESADTLDNSGHNESADSLRALHKLLTEAAEKP